MRGADTTSGDPDRRATDDARRRSLTGRRRTDQFRCTRSGIFISAGALHHKLDSRTLRSPERLACRAVTWQYRRLDADQCAAHRSAWPTPMAINRDLGRSRPRPDHLLSLLHRPVGRWPLILGLPRQFVPAQRRLPLSRRVRDPGARPVARRRRAARRQVGPRVLCLHPRRPPPCPPPGWASAVAARRNRPRRQRRRPALA
jgi:hypothetical protein